MEGQMGDHFYVKSSGDSKKNSHEAWKWAHMAVLVNFCKNWLNSESRVPEVLCMWFKVHSMRNIWLSFRNNNIKFKKSKSGCFWLIFAKNGWILNLGYQIISQKQPDFDILNFILLFLKESHIFCIEWTLNHIHTTFGTRDSEFSQFLQKLTKTARCAHFHASWLCFLDSPPDFR